MQSIIQYFRIISIVVTLCLTVGCDGGSSSGGGCGAGGSSSSGGDGIDLHLEGTLHEKGFDLATTVYLRDSAENQRTTRSHADGTFVFDETGLVPPFILWATLASTDSGTGSVVLYSTCGEDGTVNISSLTHLVTAIALGRSPSDVYMADAYAPAPDANKVARAQRSIHRVLADVYTEKGLSADIDLMVDDMGDEITGYRQILNLVRGDASDYRCALYDRAFDTRLLWDDDMRDDTPLRAMTAEETWIVLNGMPAAQAYFDLLNRALADNVVDAREQNDITALWAPDILNQGLEAARNTAALADGNLRRINVQHVEGIEYDRNMYGVGDLAPEVTQSISEKGAYEKGFWCATEFEDRGFYELRLVGFVLKAGQWLVYGDRIPFKNPYSIQSAGLRVELGSDPRVDIGYFQSGLKLSITDQEQVGQNLGVRKVVVINEALPLISNPLGEGTMPAMVLAPQGLGPHDHVFRIAEPADYTQRGPREFYLTEDGLDIDMIHNDPHFFLIALDENGTAVYAWTVRLYEPPQTVAELERRTSDWFPLTTTLGSSELPINVPYDDAIGSLNMTWQNPSEAEIKTLGARIEWFNEANGLYAQLAAQEISNPALADGTIDFDPWHSVTFNPAPEGWEARIGLTWLWAQGPAGELFIDVIEFSVDQ